MALKYERAAVVDPIFSRPPGLARLRALTDAWFAYLAAETFEGGCFFTNALLELDNLHEVEARGAVAGQYGRYLDLIERLALEAIARGELRADLDPRRLKRRPTEPGRTVCLRPRHDRPDPPFRGRAGASAARVLDLPLGCPPRGACAAVCGFRTPLRRAGRAVGGIRTALPRVGVTVGGLRTALPGAGGTVAGSLAPLPWAGGAVSESLESLPRTGGAVSGNAELLPRAGGEVPGSAA